MPRTTEAPIILTIRRPSTARVRRVPLSLLREAVGLGADLLVTQEGGGVLKFELVPSREDVSSNHHLLDPAG